LAPTLVPYVVTFGIACVAAYTLTPLARRLAVRVGALHPPEPRSVHTRPTPFLGGLAIYLAFWVAILAVAGLGEPETLGLLIGGTLILGVGLWDDTGKRAGRPLRAGVKLAGQAVAAAVALGFGVRIEWVTNPWGGMIFTGVWGIPLTVLWILAVVNVVNLVDGLDGLAAGIIAIAAVTLVFIGITTGQAAPLGVFLAAGLAGGAAGFLPYNFNPAKIFMGDTGSLFVGYVLAVAAVEGTLKSAATVGLGVPLLALGVPILDTAFAIVRRTANGRPIYEADRDHLHHRLLAAGLTHRQAVLLIWLVSAFFGVSAFALVKVGLAPAATVVLLLFAMVFLGARKVGLLAIRPSRHLRH